MGNVGVICGILTDNNEEIKRIQKDSHKNVSKISKNSGGKIDNEVTTKLLNVIFFKKIKHELNKNV